MGCCGSKSEVQQFNEACLRRHNELRARHNAPPLRLDNRLNGMARKWAFHLAKIGHMEHSEGLRYKGDAVGENIHSKSYMSTDPRLVREKTIKGEEAADSWYEELHNPGYSFARPGFKPGTGHFTQVVWKETTRVGFGVAKKYNKDREVKFFVVANYHPAGNVNDPKYFKDNVLPPTGR